MSMIIVISTRDGTLISTRHATYANAWAEVVWRKIYGDSDIEITQMEESIYVGL